jgi:uncharacterized RDD family membrane protein YckC
MTNRTRDNSLGVGTYFAADAHVGLGRRLLSQIIDVAVLISVSILLWIASVLLFPNPGRAFLLAMVVVTWAYLAVAKQSKIRTIGFRLTNARIVTLRGQKPSILRMTFRLLLWMFGPFNFLFDLIWIGPDNDRRTLRDCFAGTCVVNNDAEPLGTAEIHLVYYNALGFNLVYPRVCRPDGT